MDEICFENWIIGEKITENVKVQKWINFWWEMQASKMFVWRKVSKYVYWFCLKCFKQ